MSIAFKAVRGVDGKLVVLAEQILANHREELRRLFKNEAARWNGGYHRWTPEQLTIYQRLLQKESKALSRVVNQIVE
jgi:hypothetical protein